MPPHNLLQGSFQLSGMERSFNLHRAMNVIRDVARFQLVNEPEALLRIGQRKRLPSFHRLNGRKFQAKLLSAGVVDADS